ncbi:uncharacterized protein E0L32_010479 [Thyridium curvatum]|uniref:Uncharacterized protein n=1 Tax=Thyridium curvatum TaxID=1093900 RepID=A0A507AGA5_9PEZI|nr:uncharacterized protein E0L32_010479 [Thyridium curvatum]TPX07792.1 hypothetical protein E0L32_010479 [Thyridium curvatum]
MPARIAIANAVAAAARPTTVAGSQVLLRRSIASTASLRHKESASHNPDSHEVDKHKGDLLKKHKDGQAHWKPELASDSEEAVKADRAETDGGGASSSPAEAMKKLQERTKKAAEETSKAGTSMRDGL